jgi:hypothetical protein
VSKDVNNFINTIKIYFHNIDDPLMYENDNVDEETCLKKISKKNELYKEEITYLIDAMENMKIDYAKKVQEYDYEKKLYDKNIELLNKTLSNKAQIE